MLLVLSGLVLIVTGVIFLSQLLTEREAQIAEREAQKIWELLIENLVENRRPKRYITNDFEVREKIVVDHATGLMWQQSGSEYVMLYKDAKMYVQKLNQQNFAGYSDWRLPTVEELISLLEPEESSNGYFINPVFDSVQRLCWGVDIYQVKDENSTALAWRVNFDVGDVYRNSSYNTYYVRAVRS